MTREEHIFYLKNLRTALKWERKFSDQTIESLDEAIKALEQELTIDVSVPHKIAEFFSNWDGDEDAKMEISVEDMREIAFIYRKKARAEWQLKEIKGQRPCINKLISKLEDEKFKLCRDDIHCGFDGGLERAKQIVKEFYEVAE